MRAILKPMGLTLVLYATTASAQAEDVTTFTLDNGMDVVVIEDHRSQALTNMVWYRTGAADEPAGKSGIAHFLEHLMFKGTDKMAAGEFSATVAANGGTDNAFTSKDYTAYYQQVAADRLDLMLKMEADRMVNLQMTEQDVATERDVILEERNMRIENSPQALFSEQADAAQYLNHPYGIPVIGWRHEMEQLNQQDALTFYHQYYAPNNAILVVAGDVEPDQVRELANQYFGPIAPNPDLKPRVRPQEPPQLAERRLNFSDPRISQPYLVRSYLAPERNSGDQRQAAALTLLASLLGGDSTTSYLATKLQFDTQTAVYTSASYSGMSLDKTEFNLIVVPAQGVELADAEKAMDQAVADFIAAGPDPEDLERIKTQFRASEIYAMDSTNSRANRYGAALAIGLTVQDVQDWVPTVLDISADEIIAAAKTVLDRRASVTGFVTPSEPVTTGTEG
ncbi:M16 family metallopeptidase [Donghicola mangrovi]|uniref:Insulinase family protein n=1 Tax=Donghicola mangrovi TaxID=2729614 RepID=A0A850Q6C2_9RHOB|nr:insulinase family protein [Donghicola mangrovi]